MKKDTQFNMDKDSPGKNEIRDMVKDEVIELSKVMDVSEAMQKLKVIDKDGKELTESEDYK